MSQSNPPQSICVLRLSAIGDVCHAVAVVQAIQRQYPQCRITWIVGKVEAALVRDLPGIEVLSYDKHSGWDGLRRLRQQLRGRRFDVLLHMQIALRASLLSLFIRAKRRIGFDRARAGEGQWLFTNERIRVQQHPHVLEGFQAFAEQLGVPVAPPLWHIPVSKDDQLWAQHRLPDGPEPHNNWLVIAPFASKPERNWTLDGYVALIRHAQQRGMRVVLCGGPGAQERQFAATLQEQAGDKLVNLVGQTTLKQLLAVLARVALVVAPDTGPAHMAVTQGVPVIGLYCHSNPRRTGPYLWPQYVVNHYDDFIQRQRDKPWQALPWGSRAKGSQLMQSITVDEVLARFDQVLSELSLL